MKDFGQWLRDAPPIPDPLEVDAATAHIASLEDAGVIDLMNDGSYMVRCCVCGRDDELPCDPGEIDVGYEHYCNGSPRCCP
ncbi:hypothetical protein [Paraburkholderia bryophila]|uniref:Uncharacterized protein n=1 Tax=Paraburkholderia bryophila TaxID=420952 RepID=A0A7Z0B5T5_9BURK|nr:hypothetical protein [Paraburkholderia bryophila]NYH21423.1 hypothetical protein [Paraburkholderia bryophila]